MWGGRIEEGLGTEQGLWEAAQLPRLISRGPKECNIRRPVGLGRWCRVEIVEQRAGVNSATVDGWLWRQQRWGLSPKTGGC